MVTGSYPPMHCGVGDYTARLAQALAQRGDVEVSVITTRGDPQSDAETARGVSRVMPDWRVRSLGVLLSAARAARPDLLHLQFPTQGYNEIIGPILVPCLSRTILGIPVVVTLHEYMPRNLKSQLVRFPMIWCAAEIIVVRPDYVSRIPVPTAWLVRGKKIRFVPNASVIPSANLDAREREAVRRPLGCGSRTLVAYFGFAYPHKGVEQLFSIADPGRHHLLLICELSPENAYHTRLQELANSSEWKDHITITGFVNSDHAAKLLAAADAVVFPFRDGGGDWNSSLHAAMSQGTFAIVTSLERHGYAGDENVYYAAPGAVNDMRTALDQYAGKRNPPSLSDQWAEIARAHAELYQSVIK
jgi:glycosyltransferase involved in cell wall biosynthesis